MQKKFNIRKGDTVLVLSGEYKGQQGKILKMITKTDRALVEGINLVSKHTKPNAKNPQGGVIKKEAPIHVSNLMLVDPATGKPTKVGKKRTEEGKLVRYSKKTAIAKSLESPIKCTPPNIYFKRAPAHNSWDKSGKEGKVHGN